MRLAVISDIHFWPWQYGSKLIGNRNSRLLAQENVLKQFTEYVQENNIKEVAVTGDIFDKSKVPAECLMTAHNVFSELKKHAQVYFLVGNHDAADRETSIHALSFLNNYGTVIDQEFTETFDYPICGLPYTEDLDRLQSFLDKVPNQSIVLLHQGVSGVEVNSKGFTLNELLTPSMIPDHVWMAFSGHYHTHKQVKHNLVIPGAPMQHNWGDKNDVRGWVDFNVETREIKHIESKAPKFIEVDLDTMGSYDSPQNMRDNFVRVLTTQNVSAEDMKDLFHPAASVEIIHQKKEVQYEKIDKFDTIPGLFEEFIRNNNLSEEYVKVGRELIK